MIRAAPRIQGSLTPSAGRRGSGGSERERDHYCSRVSLDSTKGPPSHQCDISEVAENTMPVLELDNFPEDILHHIHSLVPLKDAARAASVSRRFLRSWRRFPNLTFNWRTLGLNLDEGTSSDTSKKFIDRIQNILDNHSGNGVEKFKLHLRPGDDVITANHLDSWLQAFVKSGIVELAVDLPRPPFPRPEYNLPCSLLSRAARNLKSVTLDIVKITEELECFLSCTISLEKLDISQCQISLLKIPSHLQQFRILHVDLCERLQMIEIYAPKVTKLMVEGPPRKISISDSSQLKTVCMDGFMYSGVFEYALTKLHSIAANLETLTMTSSKEAFNMLASPDKFLCLRQLKLYCCSSHFQSFDFFSLVSFLEACPALESFFLSAGERYTVWKYSSILKYAKPDSFHMRRIPEFHHDKLKKVTITAFSSSKSLIELTCQILESASSLQSLVLDTTTGYDNSGICDRMDRKAVIEALKGLTAIERYVEGKVPSNVTLEVLKPCVPCHISKL
ncbi:hypothetical protein ACP4OV_017112 [Aristida adscensionis]